MQNSKLISVIVFMALLMSAAATDAKNEMGAKSVPYKGWVLGIGAGGYTTTSNWGTGMNRADMWAPENTGLSISSPALS